MMEFFFLDTEFTHGNFYLGQIFEISVLSGRTGNVFQSYVNVPASCFTNYVRNLCGVDMKTIDAAPSFAEAVTSMLEFIVSEQLEVSGAGVLLIAHGGFFSDFPMLLTNMDIADVSLDVLRHFRFSDSVMLMGELGIERPGLSNFLPEGKVGERRVHSAIDDVHLLQEVVTDYLSYEHLVAGSSSFGDILVYRNSKIPISIRKLRIMVSEYTGGDFMYFRTYLSAWVMKKTSLTLKNLDAVSLKFWTLY